MGVLRDLHSNGSEASHCGGYMRGTSVLGQYTAQ